MIANCSMCSCEWWEEVHGGGLRWCEPCCLSVQIAHAEERAEALPELRRRLAELTTSEVPNPAQDGE